MNSVDRSSPPNAQQVGFLTGTSITWSRRPSSAYRSTRYPSHTAFQTNPSLSTQEPSGTPGGGVRATVRRPRGVPEPVSYSKASIAPVALSANHMVRPSGEKHVPLAQPTSPKSRVTVRSGSSRQTDEIRASASSSMPPAMKRPCRSVRPSFSRGRTQVRFERGDGSAIACLQIEQGKAVVEAGNDVFPWAAQPVGDAANPTLHGMGSRLLGQRIPRPYSAAMYVGPVQQLVLRGPEDTLAVQVPAVDQWLGVHIDPPSLDI